MRRARRWSDRDRYFGPFTFASGCMRWCGAMFDTGNVDLDGRSGAELRVHAFRCTFIVAMPSVFKRGREYGAFLSEGMVHIHYGPQTLDSHTTRSKLWRVPWLNWRHVRHSLYALDGQHFATEPQRLSTQARIAWFDFEKTCPSVSFEFDDFDGERIVARTHIEESEWRLGDGWCAWLSAFRRPRIHRSLDIDFSKETGPKKGSWKGGTVGHSIEMRPGELHESAFRRYCAEHRMTFLGKVSP